MYDIVVLGAGVVGLSTAVNVQSLLPGRRVTVVADKFTKDTTSDGAAGIFRPTIEKTPVKSIQQYRKWCQDSFRWFHRLNVDNAPEDTGVIRLSGYHFSEIKSKEQMSSAVREPASYVYVKSLSEKEKELTSLSEKELTLLLEKEKEVTSLSEKKKEVTSLSKEEKEVTSLSEKWKEVTSLWNTAIITYAVHKPPEFHYGITELTGHELRDLPGNNKYGWRYATLMIECRRYLPWLTKMFLSRGGQIEKKTIKNIGEFAGKCTLLVNCAGLGSRQLLNDKEAFPVRGHLIRVKAPWIKHFYVWDDAASYIYPGQDNVVLGGTRQKDQYGTSDGGLWFNDVMSRCENLLPGLKNAEIENKWTGLRPHRSFIKLESENFTFSGKQLQVVHNYGHGANGVALSWGTSLEAAQIVRDIVVDRDTVKAKL